MDTPLPDTTDQLEESFDIVARQDSADAAIGALRSDVDEVKARLDKVARAASRPQIEGASGSPQVKGFVDGYLRRGSTAEIKSIQGSVPADGGYAVPREIDALIASRAAQQV